MEKKALKEKCAQLWKKRKKIQAFDQMISPLASSLQEEGGEKDIRFKVGVGDPKSCHAD